MSFACIYACVSQGAWCLGKPKENTRYPKTGVIVVSLHVGAGVLDKNTKAFNYQAMSPPPFLKKRCICTLQMFIWMPSLFLGCWDPNCSLHDRKVSALNCWAISSTPLHLTLWTLDFQLLYCDWSVSIFFYPVMKYIPSWVCLLSVCYFLKRMMGI